MILAGAVAIVGCGGLGVPAVWTLALGGIRRFRLIDADVVELSNLHRQVAYGTSDVGQPKGEVLAAWLRRGFPGVEVECVSARLGSANALELLTDCRAAIECTDDSLAKFLLSDAAVERAIPAVIAAAIGRRGQWFSFVPGGPCFRCLFEAPPPADTVATCAVAGVVGPSVGQVGALAARSLLHSLAGTPDPAAGALMRLGARGLQRTAVLRAADCPCVRTSLPTLQQDRITPSRLPRA